MNALIAETDDAGRPVAYNGVAGVVVTSNDGGAHHAIRRSLGPSPTSATRSPGQALLAPRAWTGTRLPGRPARTREAARDGARHGRQSPWRCPGTRGSAAQCTSVTSVVGCESSPTSPRRTAPPGMRHDAARGVRSVSVSTATFRRNAAMRGMLRRAMGSSRAAGARGRLDGALRPCDGKLGPRRRCPLRVPLSPVYAGRTPSRHRGNCRSSPTAPAGPAPRCRRRGGH